MIARGTKDGRRSGIVNKGFRPELSVFFRLNRDCIGAFLIDL